MRVYMGPYPGKKSKKTERTIRVELKPYDVWSFDHTLAYIILPGLEMLKESKCGSPYVDDSDVPEEIRSTNAAPKENEWDTDEHFHKRWNYVLDEMIFAFKSKMEDWEGQFSSGEFDKYFEEVFLPGSKEALFEWKDGPNHTFKIDWDARNAYQERISNGFRLFGKYFESLWD